MPLLLLVLLTNPQKLSSRPKSLAALSREAQSKDLRLYFIIAKGKPELSPGGLPYNDGYDARTLRELLEIVEVNKIQMTGSRALGPPRTGLGRVSRIPPCRGGFEHPPRSHQTEPT
jgi:hypothetical protein